MLLRFSFWFFTRCPRVLSVRPGHRLIRCICQSLFPRVFPFRVLLLVVASVTLQCHHRALSLLSRKLSKFLRFFCLVSSNPPLCLASVAAPDALPLPVWPCRRPPLWPLPGALRVRPPPSPFDQHPPRPRLAQLPTAPRLAQRPPFLQFVF